jgi:hypothetical protein
VLKNVQNLEGEALVLLADAILRPIEEPSVMPRLARALPPQNLVPGSEVLFRSRRSLELAWRFEQSDLLDLGDPAGGTIAAEGVYAQYIFDRADANLFVIEYKDPARAAAVEKAVVELMRKGAEVYRHTEQFHEVKRPDGGTALARRRGALLVVVPSTNAAAAVKAIVNEMLLRLDPEK